MSTIAQIELLLAIAISLAALSIVIAILTTIVQLRYGKNIAWWAGPTFWFTSGMLFVSGFMVATFAWGLWGEPSTYTRQVGLPQAVQVEHLDFIAGTLGFSSVVRVDTDRGIYFLNSYTPIPKAGTIYAIERRKFWGTDTQEFLCLSASLIQCWPILTNLEWDT